MSKPHSHDAVGKIIGYVCRVLATGCFPTLDISGQPFPEGSREFDLAGKPFASASTEGHCWRAAFCAWKGDLEARAQIHKLTRNYMANWICEHCAAGRLISFGDFSANAAWKDARFNHQQFLMMTPDNKRSAWLHVPGWTKDRNLDVPCSVFKLPTCLFVCLFVLPCLFWDVCIVVSFCTDELFNEDLLHTLHQGVACCAIAGLVLAKILLHDPACTLQNLDRHLLAAYRHYRAWCRANSISGSCVRFNRLRFGKEQWKSFPELSTQYKASTVKYMQYWVHAYLMDNRVAGDDDLVFASYALAMFQHELDVHGGWMDQSERHKTAHYGFTFLLFYQKLAGNNRGEKRNFKMVPKFHYFYHMCEYIDRTGRNPRCRGIYFNVWNFYV